MRLALVLAAPFPLPQGSQVFVAGQARALRAAGADLSLFCYGAGLGAADPALDVNRTPRALTPRALRSSANPIKAVPDLALAAALARAHRRRPFDAVLAHNTEAAAAALLVRPALRVPIVYVVHTLLRHELSAYGPRWLAPGLDALGGRLERAVAGRADGIVTLCEAAHDALAPHARGPVCCIPPGFEPAPAPTATEQEDACRAHGVEPGRFALYAGNLDVYQDLDRLDAAAARLPDTAVLAVTHDRRGRRFEALRVVEAASAASRALLHACGVAVLPRRRPGGFPIKLLNYLEAGRAVVAHAGVGAGLIHGQSAWLLADDAGAEAWAGALRTLLGDTATRERLGRAGRRHLECRHAWPGLAGETLAFVNGLLDPQPIDS